MTNSTVSKLSVVICTFNRCTQLRLALKALVALSNEWQSGDEILVINNNSTDQTNSVCHAFYDRLPLRCVIETEQGLSAARNRGLRESANDAVVFFDDDVTLSAGCLAAYRTAFVNDKDYGFFGGPLSVAWFGRPIKWYKDTSLPLINGMLGHYNLGATPCAYDRRTLLPYGANFGLRKSVVDKVGYFDTSYGVKGESIARGEETDYFVRAMSTGIKGRYLPDASATHHFQTERMSTVYCYRYGIEKGVLLNVSSEVTVFQLLINGFNMFFRGVLQLFKGRLDRFYQCVINIGIQRGLGRRLKANKGKSGE